MTRTGLTMLALVILTGCARTDVFHAEGVSLLTRDRDLARCEASASQSYPIAQEIRRTPRQFHPGRTVCTAEGACITERPRWTGGEVYTVDANRDSRARAVTGCMADSGYSLMSLPRCETSGPVVASTIMPALGPDSCVFPRGASGAVIYTPG